MKNILIFYLCVFLPLSSIVYAMKIHVITSEEFSIALLVYCLVYHPLISGIRLIQLNQVRKSEFWKVFIPGWNWKFFSSLFFAN